MRTVCLVTSTRADFSKTEALLQKLLSDERFNVHLVLSGSHLLIESGYSVREIRAKYRISMEVLSIVAGDSVLSMSESVAYGMAKFNTAFATLNPDIVVIHGDRFDALSAALSASLQQIFTVHLEGGELSGTTDGSLRHAITKLCHLHFVCTSEARERVIQMGESPDCVHQTGCLSYDRYNNLGSTDILNSLSLISKEYYIVIHHPNTEDLKCTLSEYEMLLELMVILDKPCVFFYPNIDPGNKAMIQLFNKYNKKHAARFQQYVTRMTNLPFDDFATLLKNAKFGVGNSSALVREACFFGTPSVIVGNRQRGRDLPANVITYNRYCPLELKNLISKHMDKIFNPCFMYGNCNAASKIADILHKVNLSTIKIFHDATSSGK